MMKKKMGLHKKIQIISVVLCSVTVATAIPVYAWFHQQREIARFQNIKSPDMLYITAAHREQVKLLEIDTIDVQKYYPVEENGVKTQKRMVYKDYVFCVAGQYVPSFTLQIAHTTNNPFIFEVYEAIPSLVDPGENAILGKDYVEYVSKDVYDADEIKNIDDHDIADGDQSIDKEDTVYYTIGDPINGDYINRTFSDNTPNEDKPYTDYATAANDDYHAKSYDTYNNVQINAEPAYWQKTGLLAYDDNSTGISKPPFYREFILRVMWPDDENVVNNKETDIIYITAKA